MGDNCCICSQIRGDAAGDMISKLLGEQTYVQRLIIESQNYAVIPSLGALVDGHVLLCPKPHFKNFANAFAVDSKNSSRDEFEKLAYHLTNALLTMYGVQVHRFEHGSPTQSARVICTVDHAHLHFVPANVDILPLLLRDPRWRELQNDGFAGLDLGCREYLYYREPNGTNWVATTDGEFDSQYLRKVFAEALGNAKNWNWREDPRPEIADLMFRKIGRQLAA